MRAHELVRLPRDATIGFIKFEVPALLLLTAAAFMNLEAFAGEGEPIALLGLAAMAAA